MTRLKQTKSSRLHMVAISKAILCQPAAMKFATVTRITSEHDLNDAMISSSRGENRQQERQEGSCGSSGQTRDVFESEGDRTHLTNHGIAVAEIGQRLDIVSSEEFLGTGGIFENPFLFEVANIALSEQPIVG